ncbi:MAG: cation diffusion facilitator family transporter [Clostridiales Family XIII bacterium]|jgi:cation diffusion facilitator family transporter|nr:cation diffusion facilitator family transporter [Clostridiales Family XIII bacterium]
MDKTREQTAMRVSRVTIACNVALSAFKMFAGVRANSAAMVSDAVHTVSDVFSTVIVIVGVKLANRSSDKEHQYGHERFECVAAIVLAVALFATGAGIGWSGARRIAFSVEGVFQTPGKLALIAAVASIAAKELMFWYTRFAAKRVGSSALMADAWHHRSDALSSVGSFAGVLGARLGFPVLDPAACALISLLILKVSVDIFRDAVGKMTDRACDEETTAGIRAVVLAQARVRGVDQLKTRLFGDRIYVDVEINADGDCTLREAHETAQRVHDAIEQEFPAVKHCMVHVNPTD